MLIELKIMLQEKIRDDIKEALRSKDALRLLVLRMLASALHNREIEKRAKIGSAELNEEEAISVLRTEAKKRRDAIIEFEKGRRSDLVEKEKSELKILEMYLPAELPDKDIEKAVQEVIAWQGAAIQKDFGRVMGEVMNRLKGQASGDRVSAAVKKMLE